MTSKLNESFMVATKNYLTTYIPECQVIDRKWDEAKVKFRNDYSAFFHTNVDRTQLHTQIEERKFKHSMVKIGDWTNRSPEKTAKCLTHKDSTITLEQVISTACEFEKARQARKDSSACGVSREARKVFKKALKEQLKTIALDEIETELKVFVATLKKPEDNHLNWADFIANRSRAFSTKKDK
jgi:hypothetical protein